MHERRCQRHDARALERPAHDLQRERRTGCEFVDRSGAANTRHESHRIVVAQVLADARQMLHHRDAERLQVLRVADARQLQQLRGVDRATANDDLAVRVDAPGHPCLAFDEVLDATRPLLLDQDARGLRTGADDQVSAAACRPQEGAYGAYALV